MAAKDTPKSVLIEKAKLAEQAERYDDMVKCMTDLVKGLTGEPLTSEERNLLSVAFKNVVGARRSSWRIINSLEKNQTYKKEVVGQYKAKVEEELNEECTSVIKLLDECLLKADDGSDVDGRVFYLKMKGDYYRYMTEIVTEDNTDKKNELKGKAEEAYNGATKAAEDLSTTHPIKLGLALNFSVFHYEIMCCPKDACELAKKAFDEAIADLDHLSEESYKDSTLIMQLLRDNLTLWTADHDGCGKEETEAAQ